MALLLELQRAVKGIFDNEYDLNISNTPKVVTLEKVKFNPATGKFEDVHKKNMAMKEKEFDDFVQNFELNKVFKIEGETDKFYPIFINTSYQSVEFTLTRDSVHWDSDWYGRIYYEAKLFASHYGHGSNFYKDIAHIPNKRQFLANRTINFQLGVVVLWLRGGTTYRLKGRGISLRDYSATAKNLNDTDYVILDDIAENHKMETFNYIGA